MTDDGLAPEGGLIPEGNLRRPDETVIRYIRDASARAARKRYEASENPEPYLDRAALLTWVLGEIDMPIAELGIEGV